MQSVPPSSINYFIRKGVVIDDKSRQTLGYLNSEGSETLNKRTNGKFGLASGDEVRIEQFQDEMNGYLIYPTTKESKQQGTFVDGNESFFSVIFNRSNMNPEKKG